MLARAARRARGIAEEGAAEKARIEHNVFVMQQTYREKLCDIEREQKEIDDSKTRAATLSATDATLETLIYEIAMRERELEQLRADALDAQEVLCQNRVYLGIIRHEELCDCLRAHAPGDVNKIAVRVNRVAEQSCSQRDDAEDMRLILSHAAELVLRSDASRTRTRAVAQPQIGAAAINERIYGDIALMRAEANVAVMDESPNCAPADIAAETVPAFDEGVYGTFPTPTFESACAVQHEPPRVEVSECVPLTDDELDYICGRGRTNIGGIV